MTPALKLDSLLRVVCPIKGVSRSTGIDFDAAATAQQRSDAQVIYDAFDWNVSYPDPDQADSSNLDKALKAILLASGTMAGKTPAQIKAAFAAAWNALP